MKTYVFDLDGTLCTLTKDGNYNNSKPKLARIDKVNKLFNTGNKIIICTARGMGRHNNDHRRAYDEFYNFTIEQLSLWGIKYHELYLGKPSGDIYIDDKGISDEDFFNTRN